MRRLVKYLKRNVRLGKASTVTMLLAISMMSCSKDEVDDVSTVEIPKDCKCGYVSFVRFAPNPIIKVINDCTGNEKVVDNPTPTQLEIADRTMYLCFPEEW